MHLKPLQFRIKTAVSGAFGADNVNKCEYYYPQWNNYTRDFCDFNDHSQLCYYPGERLGQQATLAPLLKDLSHVAASAQGKM